jgi:hypothetical protein
LLQRGVGCELVLDHVFSFLGLGLPAGSGQRRPSPGGNHRRNIIPPDPHLTTDPVVGELSGLDQAADCGDRFVQGFGGLGDCE